MSHYCNKCGFYGDLDGDGNHKRPNDGAMCFYQAAPATRTATPASEVEEYPISARIWKRERTGEWVLELSGSINDTCFTSRHTEPLSIAPEDVCGLPSLYEAIANVSEVEGLVEELREPVSWRAQKIRGGAVNWNSDAPFRAATALENYAKTMALIDEAANKEATTIAAQQAEIARLREALELITREGGQAEYRIARAALAQETKP